MREVPEWVKPGVEMIERHNGWSGVSYGSRFRIAKVHANGNFKVEGSDQQWRPWGDGEAWRTGSDYRGSALVRVTEALESEIAHSKRLSAARRVIADEAKRLDGLSRLRSGNSDEEVIATADRIRTLATKSDERGAE